jgi:hypothetical protein
MTRHVGSICIGLAISCSALPGCGEAEPAAPPKADTPPAAASETKAPAKVKKGKQSGDPTDHMTVSELREYRRQQKEAGKTP